MRCQNILGKRETCALTDIKILAAREVSHDENLTPPANSYFDSVDVRVDFRGSQFDVFVAGTSTTINDTAGQTSTLVGLIGEQIESRDCRWSSFRGWNLGSDA